METKVTGKIIVVGDNIDTDQIYPGQYLDIVDPKEIGSHCLCGVSEDIAPKLAGLIDCVSISLNTPDAAEYNKLVRPKFGEKSYQAMLDFAKECKKYVPDVVLTTVATTLTKEEEEECARICRDLGVRYRIRPWES